MKIFFRIFSLFTMIVIASGCSTSMGNFKDKSHFAYPNSNIIPLGKVKATETNFSIIFAPSFDKEDQIALLNRALEQKVGADLIINYTLDATATVIPIPLLSPSWLTVTIEGTAASMEIGDQKLKDIIDKVKYK